MRVAHTHRSRINGAAKLRTPDCRECLFLQSGVQAGLSTEEIDAICGRLWLNRVVRGQVIFLEGNRTSHLHAIRSGRVKLVKIDSKGCDHVTALLASGDIFGLEAAFDDEYATGAEAVTDCELCLVSASDLQWLLGEIPGFAYDLARYLHRQVRRSHERVVYLHSSGACARVAGFLLHHLPKDPGDPPTVPHEMTLREFGSALGLSPETVCRALGTLRVDGIIENVSRGIRIRDLDALRARSGVH